MTRKQKKMLARILVSAALLAAAKLLPTIWLSGPLPFLSVSHVAQDGTAAFSLYILPLYAEAYFFVGWAVLWRAVRVVALWRVVERWPPWAP